MALAFTAHGFVRYTGAVKKLSGDLVCYVLVAVMGVLLPFILIASGISMIPFIYWHTPFSNGLIYLCLMIGDVAAATVLYLLIDRARAMLRRSAAAVR